ncbi:MAG: hypothetical protein ACM359_07050 [Bacillota bacterium]
MERRELHGVNQWIRNRPCEEQSTDRLLVTPGGTDRSCCNNPPKADHQPPRQSASGHGHVIGTQCRRSRCNAIGRKSRRDKGYH